jgi:hypothetical protein
MNTLTKDVQDLVTTFLSALADKGVHSTILLDELPEGTEFVNTSICSNNIITSTAVVTSFPSTTSVATSMHDCVAHCQTMRDVIDHVHYRMAADKLLQGMLNDELEG